MGTRHLKRAWPLAEGARPVGTVVVSVTHLSGQYLHDPGAYHWLLEHPRTTILNHSLHVFRVGEGGRHERRGHSTAPGPVRRREA